MDRRRSCLASLRLHNAVVRQLLRRKTRHRTAAGRPPLRIMLLGDGPTYRAIRLIAQFLIFHPRVFSSASFVLARKAAAPKWRCWSLALPRPPASLEAATSARIISVAQVRELALKEAGKRLPARCRG